MQSFNQGTPWLLLVVTVAAGAAAVDPPAAVMQVPTTLDLALMQQVVDNLTVNQAISPFVMSSLMTQVWLGAGGDTKDEMTPILGLENAGTGVGQVDYLGGYSSAIDYLSSANSSVITGVFNRMYVRSGFTIKPSFSQTLVEGYGAGAQTFSSPEEAANEINTAVANVTRDRIPELLTADDVSDSVLVLVSALYFKAAWQHPFRWTRKAAFLTFDGEAERELQVDMMFQAPLSLPYADLTTFDAVSVPYIDPDFSMLLLRPAERSLAAVQKLRDTLVTLDITDIIEQLHNTRLSLSMPKFTIETSYSLPIQLNNLGITKVFSTGADFSGISDDVGLYVGSVIHKVFMEVTEEGTEAAGAGRVSFVPFSRPMSFALNGPFFAVVYNRQHKINLFTAYVAAPSSDASSEQEQAPLLQTGSLKNM